MMILLKHKITTLATLILLFASGIASAAEQKPVQIESMNFDVARSLKSREEAIKLKEEQLRKQETELAVVKKEVDEKLAKLVSLQNEVKAQLQEINSVKEFQQDSQFKNLVKIYSTMSASKAAPLLDQMEVTTVTQIFRAMKTDLVAKIITKLSPAKAVEVSKKLGMLNKNVD